jgi:hypothetical protein
MFPSLLAVPDVVEVFLEEISQNRLALEIPAARHDISSARHDEGEPGVRT